MGFRQAIDSSSLFKEVVRVQKALREENSSQLRARLNSLTKVLQEAERLNRALRLGDTSPKMVGLLNDWTLAGEDRLVLGFEAIHAYLVMAGARFKRSPLHQSAGRALLSSPWRGLPQEMQKPQASVSCHSRLPWPSLLLQRNGQGHYPQI